jgi:hypothetical protein
VPINQSAEGAEEARRHWLPSAAPSALVDRCISHRIGEASLTALDSGYSRV